MPSNYLTVIPSLNKKAIDYIENMKSFCSETSFDGDWKSSENQWAKINKDYSDDKIYYSELSRIIYQDVCKLKGFLTFRDQLSALRSGDLCIFPIDVYLRHYKGISFLEIDAIKEGYCFNDTDFENVSEMIDSIHKHSRFKPNILLEK